MTMTKIEKVISLLPNRRDYRLYGLIVLRDLVQGKKVHLYKGWTNHNRTLMNESGVLPTINAMDEVGMSYEYGNDAPREGVLGKYIYTRKNQKALSVIEAAIESLRQEK